MDNYDFHIINVQNTIKKMAQSIESEEERLNYAKSFCFHSLKQFWESFINDDLYTITDFSIKFDLTDYEKSLSAQFGKLLLNMDISYAGFYIGNLYTTLLPTKYRSKIGAYYTPPTLVSRMINLIDKKGFDWEKSKIVDPSCGGAAFLAPLSTFIINKLQNTHSIEEIYNLLNNNLKGFEIDPFAAWISQTLLEITTFNFFKTKKLRLNNLVTVQDSLQIDKNIFGKYDLVIGNPPYGKIKLSEKMREKFKRSLFGHANLYGVFMDLAIHLAKDNGIISFVTPTSFLGGQYFSNLRNLILTESPMINIDFIQDRAGVFSDVLQETALATFKKSKILNKETFVNEIKTSQSLKEIEITKVGCFDLCKSLNKAWLLPRSRNQLQSFFKSLEMKRFLSDYGYEINTGQLVWNRHKDQLSDRAVERKSKPIIWAESILPDGRFQFQARRKNHVPYITLKENQDFLLTKEEAVIVQRTTSKEQEKRIIATTLPKSFLDKHKDGVVIENHINIIKKKKDSILTIEGLNFLLNSKSIDTIFRCISGSVAVSAYELNSIPIPSEEKLNYLEQLINTQEKREIIEEYISSLYGA